MALIGSTWGLVFAVTPLGFMAFFGMTSLTGIVVNDTIVLFDYINTLRGRGLPREDAVTKSGVSRLRAIVMTSITTIGGMLPLALGDGTLSKPFAVSMIFGLLGSTFLTLLVEPAAYLALERWRGREIPLGPHREA